MEILAIGDIHGRPSWKELVNAREYDKVIFLGDYVDSFTYSNVEILANFEDIIAYKSSQPDKVELLYGNHDFQYMYGSLSDYSFICSGFRPEAYWDLYNIFYKYKDYFKSAVLIDKYLFTHAGVTNQWWKKHKEKFETVYQKYHDEPAENIAELLNFGVHNSFIRILCWEVGTRRGGLRGDHGSYIWADQQESRFGALQGYHHVVGHTPQKGITGPRTYKIDDNTRITYCDVLERSTPEGFRIEIKNEETTI